MEALWSALDDKALIKDVAMKGKFISNAIKFIAERNKTSIEVAKELFFSEVTQYVNNLIRGKQLHRASRVLNNVQLDEFFYLYDCYQGGEEEEAVKSLINERLHSLNPEMDDKADVLWGSHMLFQILKKNIQLHAKLLENLNRKYEVNSITPQNIKMIFFGTFMKQPVLWRNETATDCFFKSKNLHLMHVLEKNIFFGYVLRNELYAILKHWLQEAYWSRAGKIISSTIQKPDSFETALVWLYRQWSFEPKMMELIARREKDVIKNDFAKLGLFESREAKSVCRKLNRFFTTQTFHDNFPFMRTDEITKFVLENNLLDMLPEKFIDFRYIRLLLENLDAIYMKNELILIEKMQALLSPETKLDQFLMMMNATSDYISTFNCDFDRDSPELKMINETLHGLSAKDFKSIAEMNTFTRNLMKKIVNHDEKLPETEELLENFQSVSLDIIRDEFKDPNAISFDDPKISSSYADTVKLNYSNCVSQYQSAFGVYLLIKEIINNFMTLSRTQILVGCEEVAKLAVENPKDRELLSHAVAFLEMFSVDSRNLRCFLLLKKLCANDDDQSDGFSNDFVETIESESDLCKIEAFEVVWKVKKTKDPRRTYLDAFVRSEDWFHMVLLAKYLNFSLNTFVSICDKSLANKSLANNLIRAILFESSPEFKRRCSFSKRRRSRSNNDDNELFANGKFLDMENDLFAIILKCDEKLNRREMSFEEFQKMMQKGDGHNDLLWQAFRSDWPVVAVIAATTKLYRYKYCWITHLMLSSDFTWTGKYVSVNILAKDLVKHCIEKGFVRTLNDSLAIFYPLSALKALTTFFFNSLNGNVELMEAILKHFIVKMGESGYDMVIAKGKEDMTTFTIELIIKHLQLNLKTSALQQNYLEALCRSELSQFTGLVDFNFLLKGCRILEHTNHRMNYSLLTDHQSQKFKDTFNEICELLISDRQFETAVDLCDLMELPKDEFVYKWLLHMWNQEDQSNKHFETKKYMDFVSKYNLSIGVMIKFLNAVVVDMEPCVKKYNIMKFVLRNSWIVNQAELDALEYATILLYIGLKADHATDELPILNSEHFESFHDSEKPIIHNSLFELKALAKVDELSVSQKSLEDPKKLQLLDMLIFDLLDAGDIVQVLRIQEMFGRAPEDLKLLVYIMSIAEGVNSIYDLSKEERKLISSYGLLNKKFNRMALRPVRTSSSNSFSSSPSQDLNESIILDDSVTGSSFRENKETFLALQGLACKMKHGTTQAQRIALIYRASLFMNRNFVDLLKMTDPFELLELAASIDCENKLMVMHDIMVASQMTNNEIAEFIAKEIAACIIKTRFLQFNKDTELMVGSTSSWSPTRDALDDIWGFSLAKDLHLILELSNSSTSLGNHLLTYYELLTSEPADIPIHSEDDTLDRICQHLNRMLSPQMMSLKKQNIIRVELLITAHEAFCHECSTEGIANILNLAKHLCNQLSEKKSFGLIVKLLCGIGRYREMFYCFEILIKNEQFEALLGQFTDKQTSGLKTAILSYLNEYHPKNREFFRMAASHFQMYTELANIWRRESMDKLNVILLANQTKVIKTGRINSNQEQNVDVPYLKCSKIVITGLNDALTSMIHATEMVLMDSKTDMSLKFSSFCELIAMQIHLMKVGCDSDEKLCPCVINQEQTAEKLQYMANYELTVPQTMILIKNTDLKIDFSKAIFVRLLLEDEGFLLDYIARLHLSDEMIESIVKIIHLDSITAKQEKILNDLVMMVSDKGLKFRLASLLGLKPHLQSMLNDQGTYYYLLDSKYGTVDIL